MSGRGEERGFRYRVHRPYRQVESEIQLRHQLRLAWQDPTQGSDEGDGGSLADYVNSTVEQSPGDGDVGPGISSYQLELVVQLSAKDGDAMFREVLARRGQHYDLRDGQLMTFRPAVDRVDF
ncbi:hypothetical protein BJ322DRAFT_1108023 [Thelephora terrestris]|uniref:Uncharacterized protein n=1 Tax=Thelephora terrestris TaxID=56493 RepID=A0A9P6HG85_9AGAM|nr:hypothetical protein BJ322DRAFT_1108023 [Thelephora terrestris]